MKKSVSILVVFAMLVCLVGCQGKSGDSPKIEGPVSYNSLDEVDQTMLKTMSEIYQTCEQNEDLLWPEYRFQDVPLLMVRADQDFGSEITGAYSFNLDKFDDDMNAVEVTDIPESFGLDKVMYLPFVKSNKIERGWTEELNFHFTELQGVHTMYFKYYPNQDMHRKFVQFLTHEAFHEYLQVKLWKDVDDITSVVDVEGDYQKEVIQLDMLHGILAEQMMHTKDLDDLKEMVMDSMTLQQYLFDKYPAQEQQKQVETIEGSAEYVGIRIDNLLNGEAPDNMGQPYFLNYQQGFLMDWDKLENAENWKSFFDKDIFYDTGVAYFTALDRFSVDYKDGLNNQQKLAWDYLMETFFPDGSIPYDDAKIQEIKDKYEYDKYSDLAEKLTDNVKNTDELIK